MVAPVLNPTHGRRHWWSTSPILDAVLIAAVVAASFAIPRSAPSPVRTPSSPTTEYLTRYRRVVLLGDSITDQATETLHRRLDAEYTVTVSAVGGTRADQREDDIAALAAMHPDQVVINLGVNDAFQAMPVDRTIAALTRIATGFPSAHCVEVVTISENMLDFSQAGLNDRATILNRRIRSLAHERGWRVIPWSDIVRGYEAGSQGDGALTVDSIHPTAMGQRMLAEAYARSLDTC